MFADISKRLCLMLASALFLQFRQAADENLGNIWLYFVVNRVNKMNKRNTPIPPRNELVNLLSLLHIIE
jgi:hypothetical protein